MTGRCRACRCGDPYGVHRHLERGTWCALCPCPRYRAPRVWWPQLLAQLRALAGRRG